MNQVHFAVFTVNIRFPLIPLFEGVQKYIVELGGPHNSQFDRFSRFCANKSVFRANKQKPAKDVLFSLTGVKNFLRLRDTCYNL